MSRVELEVITDENIYNLIENSIRGGNSMISTRYARANYPSIPSTYDDKLPRQDLIYLVVQRHNFYPPMDFDSYRVMRSLHWN